MQRHDTTYRLLYFGSKNRTLFSQAAHPFTFFVADRHLDVQDVMSAPCIVVNDVDGLIPVDLRRMMEKLEHIGWIDVVAADHHPPAPSSKAFVELLPHPVRDWQAKRAILNIKYYLDSIQRIESLNSTIADQEQNLSELLRIGIALSAERDPQKLLEMILTKAREITSADAGSLYLVENNQNGNKDEKQLRFTLAQNDSVEAEYKQSVIAIEKNSMAGYTAQVGLPVNIPDAYALPPNCQFQHNRSFDEKFGYRTKSVLCIPMKSHAGEPIGVLQLINRKRNFAEILSGATTNGQVTAFDEECVRLASSLASQAAVSIENMRLYEEIRKLFESFIVASVHAIEQRDPTTSGHSERVAQLTVDLAKKVDRADDGPFQHVRFSRNDLQQLKYASLLHDFGKIGVREHVLVKAKKLYPDQLAAIQFRFKFVKKAVECQYSQDKIRLLSEDQNNGKADIKRLNQDFQAKIREIDECMQVIQRANEPTVLPHEIEEKLATLCEKTFCDGDEQKPYLTAEEARILSIPKGSLSEKERQEIESHVLHTYNFLSKIPWASNLRDVPELAFSHHEKLDGSGYPRQLSAQDIPLPVRVMTVADIFDSLTARDRPYKRAVSVEQALNILQDEVERGKLDAEVFRIFRDARIYESVFE